MVLNFLKELGKGAVDAAHYETTTQLARRAGAVARNKVHGQTPPHLARHVAGLALEAAVVTAVTATSHAIWEKMKSRRQKINKEKEVTPEETH